MQKNIKKVLCLIVVLTCYGVAEGQSEEIAQLSGVIKPKSRPDKLAFSPDGKLLVTTEDDNAEVSLWYAETSALKIKLRGGKRRDRLGRLVGTGVALPTFSPDSSALVVMDFGANEIRLWDVETGKVDQSFKGGIGMQAPVFSPDGRLLALAGLPGLQLWDMKARQMSNWSHADAMGINRIVFEPDGQTFGQVLRFIPAGMLLAIVVDQGLSLRDARNGEQKQLLKRASSPFAFSRDADRLATTGKDGSVSIWRILQR